MIISYFTVLQKTKQESSEDEGAAGGPKDIPAGNRPSGTQPLLEVSIREAEAQPFEVLMQFLYTDKIQYPRRGTTLLMLLTLGCYQSCCKREGNVYSCVYLSTQVMCRMFS